MNVAKKPNGHALLGLNGLNRKNPELWDLTKKLYIESQIKSVTSFNENIYNC